jgi:DNA polymerase
MLQRPSIVSTGVSAVTIDLETCSMINLTESGASRYASDPSTTVRVVGFALDDAPVELWYPDRELLPDRLAAAAADPDVQFIAHNAGFEIEIARKILTPRFGLPEIALERWVCTQVTALVSAMPPELERLALALSLKVTKDTAAKRLMKQMAQPGPSSPEQLQRLGEYCRRDVEVAREVFYTLPALSADERRLWQLNQQINERGIHFDRPLAVAGRAIAKAARPELNAAMTKVTGGVITTCNQVKRLVAWLNERGYPVDGVGKNTVEDLLANIPDEQAREVLELRRAGAVNAVAKFDSILAGLEDDDVARSLFRHHGASTGRASSHRIQVQNLQRAKLENPEAAIAAVLSGDINQVRALGLPLAVLGQLLRPMICARPGFTLEGGDFSAIESRLLAYVTHEERKLEVYRQYDRTGDPDLEPYLVVARWLDPVKPNRALGKLCDLAFGYQGGVKAFRNFEPDKLHPLPEAKVEQLKLRWRALHPNVERLWYALETAAVAAVFRPGQVTRAGLIRFKQLGDFLYLQLPSGRLIAYPYPRLEYDNRRRKRVVFKDNASGGWRDDTLYGGQLCENVISGAARDILTAAMERIAAAGIDIIAHVHDEVICEVPEGTVDLARLHKLLVEPPPWGPDLPIAAKTWSGRRYSK